MKDFSDNLIWKGWQDAKLETARKSWDKENSKEHWRAMMQETICECAWMIELHRIEMAEREPKSILNRIELLEAMMVELVKDRPKSQ